MGFDQREAEDERVASRSPRGALDDVDVPGLPLKEGERKAAWRKLPQRVRRPVIAQAVRSLPRDVLI